MQGPVDPHLRARLQEIEADNKLEEKKLLRQIKAIRAAFRKKKNKP